MFNLRVTASISFNFNISHLFVEADLKKFCLSIKMKLAHETNKKLAQNNARGAYNSQLTSQHRLFFQYLFFQCNKGDLS